MEGKWIDFGSHGNVEDIWMCLGNPSLIATKSGKPPWDCRPSLQNVN